VEIADVPELNPAPDIEIGSADNGYELPPGDHANEVAARNGFGPLSPLAAEVWHGQAMPCVSCGQLVRRAARECGECGQDLSDEMLDRMLLHAGPWYVHEHVRPFPGVTRERIIRQILRGVLNETSIVRGPETDHQWRFAVETPGLCRYFHKCWNCHGDVAPEQLFCPACLSDLRFFDPPGGVASAIESSKASPARRHSPAVRASVPGFPLAGVMGGSTRTGDRSPASHPAAREREGAAPRAAAPRDPVELDRLRAVLKSAPVVAAYDPEADAPPRIFGIRPFWVLGALLIICIILLVAVVQWRG
jgi:RNA polymerase subunit RPABC4/transcription elongation factor Spt4